jgi:YD repeat-containing protein
MRQVTDAAGQLTGRTYARDDDGTVVVNDRVTRTTHDQAATHAGTQGGTSSQTYGYDAVGRLLKVTDTAADGVCTVRGYTLDKNTNRTEQTTASSTPGANCPTTGGTSATHAYDSADRIVDAGYVYDAFGRTTGQPGGATTAYYDNDLVRQQTNGAVPQTWTLAGPNASAPGRVKPATPGRGARPEARATTTARMGTVPAGSPTPRRAR